MVDQNNECLPCAMWRFNPFDEYFDDERRCAHKEIGQIFTKRLLFTKYADTELPLCVDCWLHTEWVNHDTNSLDVGNTTTWYRPDTDANLYKIHGFTDSRIPLSQRTLGMPLYPPNHWRRLLLTWLVDWTRCHDLPAKRSHWGLHCYGVSHKRFQ